MDDYYITYHIDIATLHQERLLELLNGFRLDILMKYKQLTDIYYSVEDDELIQHCTTVENHSFKRPFPMLHLNDDSFGKTILAEITYELLDDWDVFREDSLCAIEIVQDIAQQECGALATLGEQYAKLLDTKGPKWLYAIYNDPKQAVGECHQLFNDGYDSEITITSPNKPFFQY